MNGASGVDLNRLEDKENEEILLMMIFQCNKVAAILNSIWRPMFGTVTEEFFNAIMWHQLGMDCIHFRVLTVYTCNLSNIDGV